jgi:putative endonuclease
MHFVYLLITQNKHKLISYVGYTTNLKKRLSLHNHSKGAKFTRGRKWKLIYSKKFISKSIALKEEFKLKKDYKLRNKLKEKYIKNENFNSTTL